MSHEPSSDHHRPDETQSDQALLASHRPSDQAPSANWLPTAFVLLVALILCLAGIYLDRNSADFSETAYNEDLRGLAPASSAPKAVDMVAFGKKQYLSTCSTCHQPTGLGLPGTYPPLAGSEWAQGSQERVIRIVLFGLTGPIKVAGQDFPGTTVMPSFGKVPGSGYNWRDDQIAAVLTYVRQEWGNKASAITTEKVAEIRSKVNRTQPWTVPELEAIP